MGILSIIVTVLIVIILVYILVTILRDSWDWDSIFLCFGLCLTTPMVWLAVCLFVCNLAFLCGVRSVYEEHHVVPIVSLQTKNGITGSFFLGSGNIGNTRSYIYYKKLGEGSFREGSLPTSQSIILEGLGDDEEARIEYDVRIIEANKWSRFRFMDIYLKKDVKLIGSYEFHVPKGTVIQEFKAQ